MLQIEAETLALTSNGLLAWVVWAGSIAAGVAALWSPIRVLPISRVPFLATMLCLACAEAAVRMTWVEDFPLMGDPSFTASTILYVLGKVAAGFSAGILVKGRCADAKVGLVPATFMAAMPTFGLLLGLVPSREERGREGLLKGRAGGVVIVAALLSGTVLNLATESRYAIYVGGSSGDQQVNEALAREIRRRGQIEDVAGDIMDGLKAAGVDVRMDGSTLRFTATAPAGVDEIDDAEVARHRTAICHGTPLSVMILAGMRVEIVVENAAGDPIGMVEADIETCGPPPAS